MLFWNGDGVIESCTLSGSNFLTNISRPETSVRSLSLDLSTRRLYYTGTDRQGPALLSSDYIGSDSQEHFRLPQLKSVYGLGVLKEYVYWTNYANNRDIIYQAPLNITSVEQVKVLKIVEKVSLSLQRMLSF